jgi:cadmium resistance protein CadD (predicted permease)
MFQLLIVDLEMCGVVSVVMALTAVWCGIAAYLVNHSFLADRFRRIASRILPFVLIGLGIYILAEASLLRHFDPTAILAV